MKRFISTFLSVVVAGNTMHLPSMPVQAAEPGKVVSHRDGRNKKKAKPRVKKTALANKRSAAKAKPASTNPLVMAMKKSTATVVPYGTADSTHLAINIYFRAAFSQGMKLQDGKILALQTGNVWSTEFKDSRDRQLAEDLRAKLKPTEMSFYPFAPSSSVSTIALVREAWTQEDVKTAYAVIQSHLAKVSIQTTFVSEAFNLPLGTPLTLNNGN